MIIKPLQKIRKYIKNWRLKSAKNIVVRLDQFIRKNEVHDSTEGEFHKLTPTIVSDTTSLYYQKSLKWAIEQEDVFNVGLSGLYGSGKSSLLKSFFTANRGYKKMSISLASFDFKSSADDKLDLSLVEKSILQQMLFSVHESRIADSSFKRVKHFSTLKLIKEYLLFLTLIILIVTLFQPSILCYTFFDSWYDAHRVKTYLLLVVIAALLFWSSYKKIRRSINQLTVEKLSLKSGEISLKSNSNESRFNLYLNEIQYFFEANHYDIVVIEDLDRFNNLEIFVRLRELNSLINNYEGVKKQGKIVFLYAVRDDLFNDAHHSERVKFFDFILPVISIMNSSNSFQMLKELLGDKESKELTDEFLSSITLGISDLRLLKNICNEYSVYKHLIRKQYEINYDPKKAFAIVVYKNLHPHDFNKLSINNGILFQLLSKGFKNELIKNRISEIAEEISEFNHELEEIKDVQSPEYIEIQAEIMGLDKERRLLYSRELPYLLNGMDEHDFKDNLDNYLGYQNDSIEKKQLKEFLSDTTIFLCLKHGYIDTSYQLYISHYREGGITINDINFIQHINDDFDLEKDFGFKLTFVKDVLARIQFAKLSNSKTLNFDLLDFMLINQSSELIVVINQFKRWHNVHQDFIWQYFERDKYVPEFFTAILSNWSGFINKLISGTYTHEMKTMIILRILDRSTEQNFSDYRKNNELSKFLKTNILLLDENYVSVDSLVKVLKALKIKLEDIQTETVNSNILSVVENELWEINYKNICFVVEQFNQDENPEFETTNESNPSTSLYSYITDSENELIIEYIDDNIELFLKNVYIKLTEPQEEYEGCLVHLLNLCEGEEVLEDILIKKNKTKIESLLTIHDSNCVTKLLKEDKVLLSWENIVYYLNLDEPVDYNTFELDDLLIQFLNTDEVKLDFSIPEIDEVIDKSEFEMLKLEILHNAQFENNVFEEFISTCQKALIEKIDLTYLSKKRIQLLVEYDLLGLNEVTYNVLNVQDEELAADLICSQMETYLSDTSMFSLSQRQIDYILIAGVLIPEHKVQFITEVDINPDRDNNRNSSLLEFCTTNFALIKNQSYERKLSFLECTSNKEFTIRKKYALLLLEENLTNKLKVIELVKAIGMNEFSNLFVYKYGGSVEFMNNSENDKILSILFDLNLVGVYKLRKKDGKIVARKKKISLLR